MDITMEVVIGGIVVMLVFAAMMYRAFKSDND